MKKINIIIAISISVIMVSCGFGGSKKEFVPNYKDQPLQGKIGGKEWKSEMGKVSMTKKDTVENWSFNFSDQRDAEFPCNYPQYEIGKVMFSANGFIRIICTYHCLLLIQSIKSFCVNCFCSISTIFT